MADWNYTKLVLFYFILFFLSQPLRSHLDVMPVHVLLEGTGPQIPAHLTRILISLITTSTDVTDKIVKVCYSKPKNKIYKVYGLKMWS